MGVGREVDRGTKGESKREKIGKKEKKERQKKERKNDNFYYHVHTVHVSLNIKWKSEWEKSTTRQ